MSNSLDPDETAHYNLSHLDLCCLQKPILSPMAVKELRRIKTDKTESHKCDLNSHAAFTYMYW